MQTIHHSATRSVLSLIEQLEAATSEDFSLVPKDEYARLKGVEEQLEVYERREDWLKKQIRGVKNLAVLMDRAESSSQTRALIGDLADALMALDSNPASSPRGNDSEVERMLYPASERPAATDTPFEQPRMQQIGVSNQDTRSD